VANEAAAQFVEVDMEEIAFVDFKEAKEQLTDAIQRLPRRQTSVLFVANADFALTPPAWRSESILKTLASAELPWERGNTFRWSSTIAANLEGNNVKLLHFLIKEFEKMAKSPRQHNALLIMATKRTFPTKGKSGSSLKQVHFYPPDASARRELFTRSAPVNSDLIDRLVEQTWGWSARDIVFLCRKLESTDNRLRTNAGKEVHVTNGEEEGPAPEVEEIVREVKPVLTEWERRTVAYHEAGHAVGGSGRIASLSLTSTSS